VVIAAHIAYLEKHLPDNWHFVLGALDETLNGKLYHSRVEFNRVIWHTRISCSVFAKRVIGNLIWLFAMITIISTTM
jgi:hypothetical protein